MAKSNNNSPQKKVVEIVKKNKPAAKTMVNVEEGFVDMNSHYTGLEYNDIVFVDSAAKTNKNTFTEVTLSSDDDEPKFSLTFPLQYK